MKYLFTIILLFSFSSCQKDRLEKKLTATLEALIRETNMSFSTSGSDMTPGFWKGMDAIRGALTDLWKSQVIPVW